MTLWPLDTYGTINRRDHDTVTYKFGPPCLMTGCTQLPSCTTPEKHSFSGIVCCSYSHIQIKFHGNSTKQSTELWQNFEDTPLGLEEPAFELFDQRFCLSELGIYIESADFLIRLITLRFVGRFANLEIYIPKCFPCILLVLGMEKTVVIASRLALCCRLCLYTTGTGPWGP